MNPMNSSPAAGSPLEGRAIDWHHAMPYIKESAIVFVVMVIGSLSLGRILEHTVFPAPMMSVRAQAAAAREPAFLQGGTPASTTTTSR